MRAWTLALLGMAVAMMIGCIGNSGDGNSNSNFCVRAATKLRSCGLATNDPHIRCDEPETDGDICAEHCALNAPCTELNALFCGRGTADNLRTCWDVCEAQHAFVCGGGETVSEGSECDGFADCSNAADEEGCPTFDCGNGETINADDQCDGLTHCSNAADEANCMSRIFTCDDGETIRSSLECDGDVDCGDGSDEAGCPPALELICAE